MSPFAKDSPDVANVQPVDETSDEPVDEQPVDESADEVIDEQPVDEPQENFPVTRKVDNPESMARDAVANGSGALTKQTVERPDETPRQDQPAQVQDTQSDYDRGQDVLRQFRDEDARAAQQTQDDFRPQTVTEQPRTFKPTINYHEGHGAPFWLGTIIFVAVAAVVVVKKFLFTDKPALTKSELFADSTERLEGVRSRVSGVSEKSSTPVTKPATQPATKPVTKAVTKTVAKPARPSKDDDDKGKHFEIRI